MQQVHSRCLKSGQVSQHADHLFHVAFAGVGDQQVLEHCIASDMQQPMAVSLVLFDGE